MNFCGALFIGKHFASQNSTPNSGSRGAKSPLRKLAPEKTRERLMGGKTYRAILGGGKRTIERTLQNQFWRPQKVGFVWSVPVSSKENDIA